MITVKKNPPSEVTDGLFVACLAVGLLAGVVFAFRLFDSIVNQKS